VTYKDAWHHIMNRALNDESILAGYGDKKYFLKLLADGAMTKRIRVLALCLMGNHYHLIVQNTSGRLSDFMRQLNGNYGLYYRHKYGGRGYVFQDRYKSTLIQNDAYLRMAFLYVLLNPVRARLVKDPFDYKWTSIGVYFSGISEDWLDSEYAESLFYDLRDMRSQLWDLAGQELPVRKSRFGVLLGDEDFADIVEHQFNRRRTDGESVRRRKDDYSFESPDRIIAKFEKVEGIRINSIDPSTHLAKRLRGKLLVLLRDRAGLKYREIMELPLFKSVRYASLGKIYKRTKRT
jgi:putative transposase